MAIAPAVSTPDEATTPDPSPTGVTGLSSAEAARRLARDGANALPRPVRIRQRLFVQLRDPLIVVLLIAAALTIATGDWADSTVIFLVAVLNTAVGVNQEIRADRARLGGALGSRSRSSWPRSILSRCGDHWAPSHSVPPIYSSWRVCGARIRRGALGKLLFPRGRVVDDSSRYVRWALRSGTYASSRVAPRFLPSKYPHDAFR